jgi:hypothetical protein
MIMTMEKVEGRGFRAVEGVAVRIIRGVLLDVNESHINHICCNTLESTCIKNEVNLATEYLPVL